MKAPARIAAVAAVVLLAPAANGGERLSLRVSPAVAFAPADLSVRATVEADRANRSMQLEVDSSDFYRSSEIQLDGEHAPRTLTFTFHDVPGGLYDLRATVRDDRGETLASTHSRVDVVSSQ